MKYPTLPSVINGEIAPFKLNYDMLRGAIKLTHENIVTNVWTADQAKHYLWVFGLNNDAISSCIEHATNVKLFSLANQFKDQMPRDYNILARHRQQFPSQYDQWICPASWTCQTDIEQHVDVPMHLVFLGVTKTMAKRIMEWTKQKNKHNSFVLIASGILESVAKLHLDWCIAIPLSGMTFGGWVSENYLALARLFCWFFSKLPSLQQGPEYKDPTRPFTTWTIKEICEWLQVRRLLTIGNKRELMNKLHNIMSSEHVPRPLPPKGGHINEVMDLTQALSVVVAYIMQQTINDVTIRKVRYHIKLFLSYYHAVGKNLVKEGKNPGWLTSYNFLCLLNTPQMMDSYRPVCNLWEGGYNGEKYSQELKYRLKGAVA
jgi:hypothetical protein